MAKPLTTLTASAAQIPRFILEARDELKKVSWPSRQVTLRYTMIVIVSSLVLGLLIGGIDYVLSFILEAIIS